MPKSNTATTNGQPAAAAVTHVSTDNQPVSHTAFGCIPMRSAVTYTLGAQMGYPIGATFIPNLIIHPIPLTTAVLVSYTLIVIWILVSLALAHALMYRKLETYRALSKLNVAVWAANMVAAGAMAVARSLKDRSVVAEAFFVGVPLVVFGYGAWVVYKYAGIMEEESAKMEGRQEGSA